MKRTCSFYVFGLSAALTVLPNISDGAAVLTNANASAPAAGAVDLTAAGTLNWAAWDTRSNTAVASRAASTVKTGGTGTISAISTTNSTGTMTVRGPSNGDAFTAPGGFSWSDGTGQALNPDGVLQGVFHSSLDQTSTGVRLTIGNLVQLTGDQYYQINVYALAFRGTTTVSATLGALTVSQAGNANSNTTQLPDLFQFNYNPTGSGDNLTIDAILSDDFGSGSANSSHASIQAVAISIVPEASSGIMVILGGLGILGIRRRKN